MPADYEEVLKDLDSRIAELHSEIEILLAARPTILLLQNRFSPPPVSGQYSGMGPTDAIPLVLSLEDSLTTTEIASRLRAGGVSSNAQNFVATVSATLSQLKDKGTVKKVGDRWSLLFADEVITDDDIPF
jgi:hypothetical protein